MLKSFGTGFYRGTTFVPIETEGLRIRLWKWGEGEPAVVFPLRTLGGALLGFQLGALHPGKYEDYFLPGAGKRGLFYYPDTFDWECFHEHGKVVITEGCHDANALSLVLKCVLSCLSARVTRGQSRGLQRWCDCIYCAFDNDETGEKAHETLEHFWNIEGTMIHRARPLTKDTQSMFETDPRRFRRWVEAWAPRELLRDDCSL